MPTVQGFNTTSGVLKYNAESLDNYNTPLFDSTSTYEVGDYVIENGKLYRCITDVSTAGDWSSVSSNFVAAILTDDIKNIKGNVSELTTDVSTLENDVETLGDNVETLSTDVQTLSTNVNNLGTSVNKINNSIAPMFSALTSYNSGDYVVYGGSLYRFTSDHTAGAWTGIDAVQVKLTEDMVFIPGTGEGSATMREDSASGQYSFAQGQGSDASGFASSAFGNNTLANGRAQFVIGQANIEDTEDASSYGTGAKKHIFIVGNGLDASNRSNAFALDWDGNVELSGAVTVDKGENTEFKLSGTSVGAAFLHNTASGSIASFTDGADEVPMKSVLCNINPVQNLHGYDAPWFGGGGKNKCPLPTARTQNGVSLARNVDGTITLSGTSSAITYFDLDTDFDSTAYAGYVLSGFPSGFVGDQSTVVFRISASATSRASLQDVTTSGSSEIRNNGQHLCLALRIANNYAFPVRGLVFKPMLRAANESADFTPYSNICPISGFTGMTIYKTGARIYDKTRNNVGYIRSNGTIFNQSSYRYTDYMQIDGQPFVYGGLSFNDTYSYSAYYDENKQLISTWKQVIDTNVVSPPSTAKYVSISMPDVSVDTFFAYAKATTYPITWQSEAGTVYEGTLDVVSGLLTVTMASVTLNGSETWGATNNSAFYLRVKGAEKLSDYVGAIICDKLKTYAAHSSQDFIDAENGITGYYDYANAYPATNWIYAKADGITTAADFKTWLASNPLQVVYELATPQTYQLTPTEVDSLLNDNNVWHDANGEISVEYRQNPESLKSRVEALESEVSILNERLFASFPTDMATGAIASFEDGADNIPMKSVLCAINPVQSGSGEPAPDNVRPISGFTGLTVNKTGKNLFNKNAVAFKAGYARGEDGAEVTSSLSGYTQGITRVLPNTQYTLSGLSSVVSGFSNVSFRVYYLTADGEWVSRSDSINYETMPYTFTTPAACGGVQIQCGKDTSFDTVQIEVGASASAYEAFGTTYPVSWQSIAGTVYGGTLDVVSGLLTVTMASVDFGALDWIAVGTGTADVYRMRSTGINALVQSPASSTVAADVICSSFKTVTASETYRLTQGVAVDGNGNIQVYDEEYNTEDAASLFKYDMSGVQLVYELAAPQTYQLSPIEVDSLLGVNSMWHDANGNTTANYRADTALYINKKIAALGG